MMGATGLSSNKERISGVAEYCILAYSRSASMVLGNCPAPPPISRTSFYMDSVAPTNLVVALFCCCEFCPFLMIPAGFDCCEFCCCCVERRSLFPVFVVTGGWLSCWAKGEAEAAMSLVQRGATTDVEIIIISVK